MINLNIQLPENFLEEETRNDCLITRETKELWAIELDLLYELDRICKEHNLKYWADSGTLLGAIRHKGFIPWDDDIDVVMMRDDYEKLCDLAMEFRHPYFFQTEETDPLSLRGHAQLRNSDTTGILTAELDADISFNQGIFIDIFPLDFIPDSDSECDRFLKKINSYSGKIHKIKRITTHYIPKRSVKGTIKAVLHFFVNPFRKSLLENVYYKREKLMRSYSGTKRIMKLFFYPTTITPKMEYSYFSKTENVSFEFTNIPVPLEYDNVLKTFYGNWHEIKKGTQFHSGLILDMNQSYKDYLEKYRNK